MFIVADFKSNRAWAVDAARELSVRGIHVNVHGFDISDDQFLPDFLLPDNCTLSVSDALSDPPAVFRGTFDVVHIAHFACVRALGEDPSPAIKHAMALLSITHSYRSRQVHY